MDKKNSVKDCCYELDGLARLLQELIEKYVDKIDLNKLDVSTNQEKIEGSGVK